MDGGIQVHVARFPYHEDKRLMEGIMRIEITGSDKLVQPFMTLEAEQSRYLKPGTLINVTQVLPRAERTLQPRVR
jgi:hypothetical protein